MRNTKQRKTKKFGPDRIGSDAGMALILALLATVAVVGAAVLVVDRVHSSKRQSDFVASQIVADEALKGAIDLAIAKVWSSYEPDGAGPRAFRSTSELTAYRTFLNDIVDDGASAELLNAVALDIGGAQIARLAVTRQDSFLGTELTIEASAISGGRRMSASQTVIVGAESPRGNEESAPSVFPDHNGNRYVDDAEFTEVASAVAGELRGGVLFCVERGRYRARELPDASNVQTIGGVVPGNAILLGSADSPIRFENDGADRSAYLAIDGDLVIKGVVAGHGHLVVRGNVYVIGDVVTDANCALVISAGGNILVGDYLTRPALDKPSEGALDIRFASDARVDSFSDDADRSPRGWTCLGAAAAMKFNREERERALMVPEYVPRFYRLRPGADVLARRDGADSPVRYDDAAVERVDATSLAGAAIVDFAPAKAWLSEDQLRAWWHEDAAHRTAETGPRVVASLVTGNAVVVRGAGSTLYFPGGVIAKHVAVWSGKDGAEISTAGLGGAIVDRVARLPQIGDHSKLTMRRVTFRRD